MKKIYIAIAVVLFAAAGVATVLAVRSHNRMDDFFRSNVDALTDQENAVSIPCVQSACLLFCAGRLCHRPYQSPIILLESLF